LVPAWASTRPPSSFFSTLLLCHSNLVLFHYFLFHLDGVWTRSRFSLVSSHFLARYFLLGICTLICLVGQQPICPLLISLPLSLFFFLLSWLCLSVCQGECVVPRSCVYHGDFAPAEYTCALPITLASFLPFGPARHLRCLPRHSFLSLSFFFSPSFNPAPHCCDFSPRFWQTALYAGAVPPPLAISFCTLSFWLPPRFWNVHSAFFCPPAPGVYIVNLSPFFTPLRYRETTPSPLY